MTSTATVALGPLSDYLPQYAQSLGALAQVHHDCLADGMVDSHLGLLHE